MSENVNFHMTFPPAPAYIGRLLKIADGHVRTVLKSRKKQAFQKAHLLEKSAHIFSMQVTWGCLILRILRELLLVKSYI